MKIESTELPCSEGTSTTLAYFESLPSAATAATHVVFPGVISRKQGSPAQRIKPRPQFSLGRRRARLEAITPIQITVIVKVKPRLIHKTARMSNSPTL